MDKIPWFHFMVSHTIAWAVLAIVTAVLFNITLKKEKYLKEDMALDAAVRKYFKDSCGSGISLTMPNSVVLVSHSTKLLIWKFVWSASCTASAWIFIASLSWHIAKLF